MMKRKRMTIRRDPCDASSFNVTDVTSSDLKSCSTTGVDSEFEQSKPDHATLVGSPNYGGRCLLQPLAPLGSSLCQA